MRTHRPPTTCPVCSESLITLRLGCPSCGTEVSGHFDSCRFCRLDRTDMETLEVFLRSRGNIRDVQAHLEVSYPTARARLAEVLDRLGLGSEQGPAPDPSPAPADGPPGVRPPGVRPPSVLEASPVGAGVAGGVDAAAVLADLAAGRIGVADAERLLTE